MLFEQIGTLLNAGRSSARQDAKSKLAEIAGIKEQKKLDFNTPLEMDSKLKIYAAKKGFGHHVGLDWLY